MKQIKSIKTNYPAKTTYKTKTKCQTKSFATKSLITLTKIMLISIIAITVSEQVIGLSISEIMFNPDGPDTGREWIEIELNSSDGCINLTQYKLFEENTNHNIYAYSPNDEITCTHAIISSDVNKFLLDYPYLNRSSVNRSSPNSNYSINISSLNVSLYKSSFSLSNTGEELAIKHNNEFIDYINYSLILQQVSVIEGYSLEYVDDAWRESELFKGNPGNVLYKISSDVSTFNTTENNSNNSSGYNVSNNNNDNTTNSNNNATETNNTTNIDIANDTINNTVNNTASNNTIAINTTTTNITVEVNCSNNNTNEDNKANATNATIVTNESIELNQTIEINQTSNNTANFSITNTTNSTSNSTINNNITNASNNTPSNASNGTIIKCQVSIRTIIKNTTTIYENNIPIKFYSILDFDNTSIAVKNYSIEYWIEDLFGNIIKNKVITSNQDEKTYTPKIDEDDKVLIIKSVLKSVDCNITKNSSEALLIIKNSNYSSPSIQKCPSCNCQSAKESTSSSVSIPSCIYAENTQSADPKSIKPITKIVNVCNISAAQSKNNSDVQKSTTQSIKKLGSTDVTGSLSESNISNKTQNTGQTTGMIVYESPNLKNRIYALIGLILVGVTCIGIIGYRFLRPKMNTNKT